jgi:hypothetical protein
MSSEPVDVDAPDDVGPAGEATDAHTALLNSQLGRIVVFMIVTVMGVWLVGPNLPAGPARDALDAAWSPAIDAGLDQNWAVFSPNPRSQSIDVEAVLEFDDGTTLVWKVPDFDPIIGAYRSYRWRKWQERIRLDSNDRYWESAAAWIASNNVRDGREPATVRLVRRWRDHETLTADGVSDGEINEFEFYVWTRDVG